MLFLSRKFAVLGFALIGMSACRPGAAMQRPEPVPVQRGSECPKEPEPATPQHRASGFTKMLRPSVIGPDTQSWELAARMQTHGVPGVAVAVIEKGKLVFAHGYGELQRGGGDAVDQDTLFSVGSMSKVVTAMLVLKLAQERELALDQDVRTLLRTWSLPMKTPAAVNWRMLLSHTAGLNVKGFEDLNPGEPVPTILQSLNGEAPAKNPGLEVIAAPGKSYRYSGGGYLLTQLLLTELTGTPFAQLAKREVLDPLGMKRSTFENPLPPQRGNIAKAHAGDGSPTALPRGYETMPELAASGLWTSAREFGTLVADLLSSYHTGQGILSGAMAFEMMTPVAPGRHGLGAKLEREAGVPFFYHAGANRSYKAWVQGDLREGHALVVLTNGRHGDRLYVEVRNAIVDAMGWTLSRAVKTQPIRLEPKWRDSFAGRYVLDGLSHNQAIAAEPVFPTPIQVEVRKNQLMIGSALGGPKMPIVPVGPDVFVAPDWVQRTGVAQVRFHRNAQGDVIGATLRVENQENYFARAQPGER